MTLLDDGMPARASDFPLTAGFIPLVDCAPLLVAAKKGFARAQGLRLTLVRETSWANIRDRVSVGHFDAAHMLGPMPIATSLGIGHSIFPWSPPLPLVSAATPSRFPGSVCRHGGMWRPPWRWAGRDGQGAPRGHRPPANARRGAPDTGNGFSVLTPQLRASLLACRLRHRPGPGRAAGGAAATLHG